MAKIKIFPVAPHKDDSLFAPFVYIWLSQSATDNEGRVLLSAQLMTESEIDESVDKLISQLEEAREMAKTVLRKM